MIDHLDQDNDETIIASLKARIPPATTDADTINQALSAHRIRARDKTFGTTVTMDLTGELIDITLPQLYTDHYEDAWDKAAASISATAAALQSRARKIAMRAIPLPRQSKGEAGVRS